MKHLRGKSKWELNKQTKNKNICNYSEIPNSSKRSSPLLINKKRPNFLFLYFFVKICKKAVK
jgi:hypothetical protein